jgi:hypothetical protein
MSGLVYMRKLRWTKHKAGGVVLLVGKQEVGYVFPSEDGHKWSGFLNAIYHKRDYPTLEMASEDIERLWREFAGRITQVAGDESN